MAISAFASPVFASTPSASYARLSGFRVAVPLNIDSLTASKVAFAANLLSPAQHTARYLGNTQSGRTIALFARMIMSFDASSDYRRDAVAHPVSAGTGRCA